MQTMEPKTRLASSCTTGIVGPLNPKRRRVSTPQSPEKQQPNWSDLHPDLLQLILSKLSFIHILRFKAVCSSWRSVAENFISSSLYAPFSQLPCLLLPAPDQEGDHACAAAPHCLFSVEGKKAYKINNFMGLGNDFWCVGSSHGWLVLLGTEFNSFLFNPFSQTRIELPLIDFLLADWLGVRKSDLKDWIQWPPTTFITKTILLCDPSRDKNYKVVVIYELCNLQRTTKLAFCQNGDCKWNVASDASDQAYCDIMYHNNLLHALTDDFKVIVWDFQGSCPVKIREIKTSAPSKMMEVLPSMRDLYSKQSYLVESSGDLMLVVRFVGNFVNKKGEPIHEVDLLTDDDTHPLLCPYRTLLFHVYKLDFKEEKWVETEDLNGRVLFLGGSHSMSVSAPNFPGCEKNSIYFTDDHWYEMGLDDLYGGHDFGMFSLQEEIVKPIYPNSGKFFPPPFWIVPNPW